MNVDVDGLRAAAEAAPKIWLWYGGPDPTGDDVEVALTADEVRFISAAEPAVVLRLLDRLRAAEAAVGRVRDFAGSLYWHGGGKGPDLARAIRSALDGPQGDATGEVALGYTDVLRVPEKPPGWHEADALCRGCAFCDSDHGDRREGEGLA